MLVGVCMHMSRIRVSGILHSLKNANKKHKTHRHYTRVLGTILIFSETNLLEIPIDTLANTQAKKKKVQKIKQNLTKS